MATPLWQSGWVSAGRGIVGMSPAISRVLDAIATVAPTAATVLITGETGTGKELVARTLHHFSARRDRAFLNVNCVALPTTLIETELFGHEKGAFTGAVGRIAGRFELAHGGTIFLDEIGDLPLELQGKLLRVLQEGEFERVGGRQTLKVSVRVIAATNRNLEAAIRDEQFRADLYYRLNVFPIHVPPLRERSEDIPDLVRYFLEKHGARLGRRIEVVPESTVAALQQYSWPGNIRELENIVERAIILSPGRELQLPELPAGFVPARSDTLADVQRAHILHVLDRVGWRVSGERGAAKILGLKSSTLEARMKKLGIRRSYRRHAAAAEPEVLVAREA